MRSYGDSFLTGLMLLARAMLDWLSPHMKRKTFLRTLSVVSLAAATGGGVWSSLSGRVCVRPVQPELCGQSFLSFCKRARFRTAEEAVLVAGRRGHAFEVFLEGDEGLPSSPPAVPPGQLPSGAPVAAPADQTLEKLKTAMIRSRDVRATAMINLNSCFGSTV